MKTIHLPAYFEYPITVFDLYLKTDQFVIKGNELFKVRMKTGKVASIKANYTGLVTAVDIDEGQKIYKGSPVVSIDENTVLSPTMMAKSEAERDRRRDAFSRGKHTGSKAPQPQPQPQPQKAARSSTPKTTVKHAEKPTAQKPISAFPLWILWAVSAWLIVMLGFPIRASGAFFWTHIGFYVAIGIIPTALVWWSIRRYNSRQVQVKRPTVLLLLAMIAGYHGATLFATQSEPDKRAFEAFAASLPAPLPLLLPKGASVSNTAKNSVNVSARWTAGYSKSEGSFGTLEYCYLRLTAQNPPADVLIEGFSIYAYAGQDELSLRLDTSRNFIDETVGWVIKNKTPLRQTVVFGPSSAHYITSSIARVPTRSAFDIVNGTDYGDNILTRSIKIDAKTMVPFTSALDTSTIAGGIPLLVMFEEFKDGTFVPVHSAAVDFTYANTRQAGEKFENCVSNQLTKR